MKITRIVAFIITIFLLVACSPSPQETAKLFYRSVEEGDITKASSLLSDRFHKQMIDEQKLKDLLVKENSRMKNMQGIKEITVEGEPGKEIASLKVIIAYGNGQSKVEPVKMVLEDGKWKIDVQE